MFQIKFIDKSQGLITVGDSSKEMKDKEVHQCIQVEGSEPIKWACELTHTFIGELDGETYNDQYSRESGVIIEDDKMINSLLGRVLQDNGYETESAFDGAEGLKLALEKNYELILLDLMLPQKRGEEVIDAIRKVKNIPVIVLSAKTDVANRIELLRLGVDDYICKPFDVDEVVLRIEAVLRRNGGGSALVNTKLQYKCVTLDQDAKRVFVGEEELLCTGMEYSILQILLCNPGKLFTKRNLFESIEETLNSSLISNNFSYYDFINFLSEKLNISEQFKNNLGTK